MDVKWTVATFQQLDGLSVYKMLQLRTEVFVVEQECAYLETDGVDTEITTKHVFGNLDDELIAYGRIYLAGGKVHMGRIVCAKKYRGEGIGHKLVEALIAEAAKIGTPIYIAAQAHLQQWYGKHNFNVVPDGEEYLDDGIPHIDMMREAQP